jgi:arylsulfatase A-like enzyme
MSPASILVRSVIWGVVVASAAACGTAVLDSPQRPNVVIIVGDDLGYSQLGYNGYEKVATPHLDSICREGVYFTQAYVSAPTCAPSRAGLMTGRYQARFGYESLTGPISRQISEDVGVDTREIFLPRLLQQAGYTTAVIGKWHLGYDDKYHPNNRGVDYFFGFLAKGRYFWEDDSPGRGPILRNKEELEGKGYLTEVFAAEAAEFIRRSKDEPFFLYYAPWNVHTPLTVPEHYIPAGGTTIDGMIKALDDSVGVILDALRDEALEQNTLVVFVNDNGGVRSAANRPLRGRKGGLREGGIRVPLAIRWPARLPSGRTYDHPVIQLDILPTVVARAGSELPRDREYDGVDLWAYLTGQKHERPHEALYWRHTDIDGQVLAYAVRSDDLKLTVQPAGDGGPERTELYDLAQDPGETTDLAARRPADARRLRRLIETWERRVKDPRQYD